MHEYHTQVMEFYRTGLLFLMMLATTMVGPSSARKGGRKNRDRSSSRNQRNTGVSPASIAVVVSPPGENSTIATTPLPSTKRPAMDKHRMLAAQQSLPILSTFNHPRTDVQIGCKELRSKRYISDGFCTSIKPITEVVCTGHCLPIRNLPWYAEFIKVWAKTKILEWRCVDDLVKRKRVRLMCENGEMRTYRIKVVKSCKCKRYMKQQNRPVMTYGRRTDSASHHRRREKSKKKVNRSNRVPRQ